MVVYKGSLAPGRYKFPFTYQLPMIGNPTSSISRREYRCDVQYVNEIYFKSSQRRDPLFTSHPITVYLLSPPSAPQNAS
jgi:hypothetical protein